MGKRFQLLVEDRFGLISSKVPRLFKPKPIVKNLAKREVELLKRCENPLSFPLPPAEPEVPPLEGYELSVFFRLAYSKGLDPSVSYRIVGFSLLESPLVEFEMRFLAGSVPFADLSRVYLYELEEVKRKGET
ncbi:MAG: hypothetical protein GXO08_03950 [Aquificae bacterium]|nr:hypothetical protein [Aquificota bacterium]